MNLRVTLTGKVKYNDVPSRREIESEQGVQSLGVDPKPSGLSMARMKVP